MPGPAGTGSWDVVEMLLQLAPELRCAQARHQRRRSRTLSTTASSNLAQQRQAQATLTQDASGVTPLLALLQRGQFDAASQLLVGGDCGVSVAAVSGDAALHVALRWGAPPPEELLAGLLRRGANAVMPGADGDTPLLLAARRGGSAGVALVQKLLEATEIGRAHV